MNILRDVFVALELGAPDRLGQDAVSMVRLGSKGLQRSLRWLMWLSGAPVQLHRTEPVGAMHSHEVEAMTEVVKPLTGLTHWEGEIQNQSASCIPAPSPPLPLG